MTSTGIAAGWYDDGSGAQRWWDGSGWTEHVARPVAAAVAARSHDEGARPSVSEVFAAKMRAAELRAAAAAESAEPDPDDIDVDADEFLAQATPIASRRSGFTALAHHERLLGTAADLNTELGRLAAFRAQGVLDETEFVAAKRRLLGL